jgi:hypothetical protein
VTNREGAARAGLQVALELQCTLGAGERYDDNDLPRNPAAGVAAGSSIVFRQSHTDVRGDAGEYRVGSDALLRM